MCDHRVNRIRTLDGTESPSRTELLWQVLQQDVIEHLTAMSRWLCTVGMPYHPAHPICFVIRAVQGGVLEEIDAIVHEEVARRRPDFIPQDVQDELRKQQRELEGLQRALHDSYVASTLIE